MLPWPQHPAEPWDAEESHLCLVEIHTDDCLFFPLNFLEKGTPLATSCRIWELRATKLPLSPADPHPSEPAPWTCRKTNTPPGEMPLCLRRLYSSLPGPSVGPATSGLHSPTGELIGRGATSASVPRMPCRHLWSPALPRLPGFPTCCQILCSHLPNSFTGGLDRVMG